MDLLLIGKPYLGSERRLLVAPPYHLLPKPLRISEKFTLVETPEQHDIANMNFRCLLPEKFFGIPTRIYYFSTLKCPN